MKKLVEPYEPEPKKPSVFRSASPKVDGFRINSIRIGNVFAYVSSPRKAEKIRQAVVERLPGMGFRHVESPVEFASANEARPAVLFVDDETVGEISRETIARTCPQTMVALLSSREAVCSLPVQNSSLAMPEMMRADLIAPVKGAGEDFGAIVHAFIHLSEDKLNIEADADGKRFVVLVVDDEPRWLSKFLPQLYGIIGRRANIYTRRTFEEAAEYIDSNGDCVVCLISDMAYPKGGALVEDAGRQLVDYAHSMHPRIAKVIASKGGLDPALREKALLLPKDSEGYVSGLRQFILDFAGFGDFIIPVGDGNVRARSIMELRDAIMRADIRVLESYGEKDFYSSWLYLHGFHGAGDRLRPSRLRGEPMRGFIIGELDYEISMLRKDPFVIAGEGGAERCRTHSLEEIISQIGGMPAATLGRWDADDYLSFWMMRHGHTELADELRPVQGDSEGVKGRVLG
ncbi:MAG TPA: hypothetical protein PKJ97_01930, partial [Candidatus Bilamarchaeaceae archaeon]|nr:hypothetical protein [Candidatus Bilamarchaeaceae archaeon]